MMVADGSEKDDHRAAPGILHAVDDSLDLEGSLHERRRTAASGNRRQEGNLDSVSERLVRAGDAAVDGHGQAGPERAERGVIALKAGAEIGDPAAVWQLQLHLVGAEGVAGTGEGEQADPHRAGC